MQKVPFHIHPRKRRGIALIIVLVAVVLLTVLVLAFLTSVGTELQTSKMYANGSSVKLLAQSSVALVTGEIQAGTADPTLCWASQPGMIRTYKNDGTPNGYYKLYSDDGMFGTGAFDATQPANLPPNHLYSTGAMDWYSQKGVYVDLNQPVYVNGINYYPILDGNKADYSSSQYSNPLSALTVPKPSATTINTLTPMTSSLPAVTGFWLDGNTPVDTTTGSSPNVAPMPVKWLYVLKNGEVITPDSNPVNNVVTFNKSPLTQSQPQPSKSDPIVGRIAFWTDDETCKVNINTASDGKNVAGYGFSVTTSNSAQTTGSVNAGTMSSFWDTPRTNTPFDYGYAFSQPAQNEFQRYPGHPATVALSAVFNSFTNDTGFPENLYSSTTTPSLTPRVSKGGSQEGTQPTFSASAIGSSTLNQLGYRLYATPDEFMFQPTLSGSIGVGTRGLNSTPVPALTPAILEQAKFFITASSEAPDVNTFNLPRVSMWPITLNNTTGAQALTAYDQMLSFCATISGSIYYFQRQYPNPLPGQTDLPLTNTGVLGRNRILLEYLRTLTNQTIPGFGGTFQAKYNPSVSTPGDRDQILTEMFDYIRCTNLEDNSTGATQYAPAINTSPLTTTAAATTDPYVGGGLGQVVPIVDGNIKVTDTVGGGLNNPRGFGRFPTVQQAALMFIGAGDSSTSPAAPGVTGTYTQLNPPSSYTPAVAANKERVQAGFFLQMYDPTQGLPVAHPWYVIQVSHLDNLLWDGQSIFPAGANYPYWTKNPSVATYLQPLSASANSGQLFATNLGNGFVNNSYGGVIDFRQQSMGRDNIQLGSPASPTTPSNKFFYLPVYPYLSPPTGMAAGSAYSGFNSSPTHADMPAGGTFTLSSTGDVQVQIFAVPPGWKATNPGTVGTASGPVLVQTINLTFPSATCPVPYSINNNTSKGTPPAPYNTAQYLNPAYHNLPNWPSGSTPPVPGPASYLPASGTTTGTTTTYTPYSNPGLYNFLGFLDMYGAYPPGLDTYGVGTENYGRLGWGSGIPYVTPCDVIRAVIASDPSSSTSYATAGDVRLIAARQNVTNAFYQPMTANGSGVSSSVDYTQGTTWFSHMLRIQFGCPFYGSAGGALLPISGVGKYAAYSTQYANTTIPNSAQIAGTTDIGDSTYQLVGRGASNPADNDVVNQTKSVYMGGGSSTAKVPGDWDTGFANTRDGAYINRADEGDMGTPAGGQGGHVVPYFEVNSGNVPVGTNFFSPNRMVPSSGMFGSLPTGVWADHPWQTLLFRPGPLGHKGLGISASGSGDSGAPYTTPPDHLFMDLFTMPVVEPYAISTPLATAGRINMNYQIVPFTYINRDTGLRAVMKNQMLVSLPATATVEANYKISGGAGASNPTGANNFVTRYSINLDATLSQFLARFNGTTGTQGCETSATGAVPDVFHSASEICDIDLVPNDTAATTASNLAIPITRAHMDAYWAANALTGDNIRERPYANIYPLLTTKSNTFTVHYRVETLKQIPGAAADAATWREGTDAVLAEYRGSQTIERYVDPTTTLPDYAATVAAGSLPAANQALSQYYKFRTVSTKQFPP